jgi:hypothetical protein
MRFNEITMSIVGSCSQPSGSPPMSGDLRHAAHPESGKNLIPWENARIEETRIAFRQFRRMICADCESYGDPKCICPLVTLCLTGRGRELLENERRQRSLQVNAPAS